MIDLHKTISGAMFDFAGFLTTRPDSTAFGSCEDANAAVEMLKEWADTRGLQLDEADVTNWSEALAKPAVPPGYALVPESALKWLHGEEGVFECPPEGYFRGQPAPYWWRTVFRKMCAAPQPKDKP